MNNLDRFLNSLNDDISDRFEENDKAKAEVLDRFCRQCNIVDSKKITTLADIMLKINEILDRCKLHGWIDPCFTIHRPDFDIERILDYEGPQRDSGLANCEDKAIFIPPMVKISEDDGEDVQEDLSIVTSFKPGFIDCHINRTGYMLDCVEHGIEIASDFTFFPYENGIAVEDISADDINIDLLGDIDRIKIRVEYLSEIKIAGIANTPIPLWKSCAWHHVEIDTNWVKILIDYPRTELNRIRLVFVPEGEIMT